jgi:hypothetical protein
MKYKKNKHPKITRRKYLFCGLSFRNSGVFPHRFDFIDSFSSRKKEKTS